MYPNFPPLLLSVPHLQQQAQSDCLAACVSMVLTQVGISFNYRQLLQILKIQEHGTGFFNLRNLERLGFHFMLEQGDIRVLYQHLQQGYPCVVPVQTGELTYWRARNADLAHAVVVVGFDGKEIYLNDPAVATAPIRETIGDFDLARLVHDEKLAYLRP